MPTKRAERRAKPVPKAKPATKTRAAKAPAAKAPPARAAKVPIAVVRALEAALSRDDLASQVAALAATLGQAGSPPAAAAAVLAHTRKGTPVARAYLEALATGDRDAADTFVRHAATMERGRVATRAAFVAIYRHASDRAALEAAYQNYARGILDDPGILEAGVHAATELGDQLGRAERAARLDRASRLAPLVADLAGAAPARERAAKQLAALAGEDRWHVHARVLSAVKRFDQAVATAAVMAGVDDPRVPDMVLSAAIADLRYHGQDDVVAAWKARVGDGDTALTTRLLGLFEWTALWATDDDHLEPYIHALYPAGGRAEVFAHVEHAMASPNIAVREAVCEEWLREPPGQRAFDDAQIDKLVRCAIAIAENGDDTDDQRAANRALFYMAHPGARHALVHAIRHASTKKNDELRRNMYFGLSHIDHPEVWPFFIERLFDEREEYWALLDAMGDTLDAARHRSVLAALARKSSDPGAAHAACAYAEVLIDKKPSPRLLIELQRAIAGWKPRSNDDARRLRYVAEQAAVAALAVHALDDARDFVARAEALPGAPYSDYRVVDRDTKTPAPFADAETKKQLAALAAGTLDRALADTRAAAAAARAAGKPIAADDARLGALAGCTVAGHLLDVPSTKVVWFWDEVGELHVYDGYSVVAHDFTAKKLGYDDVAAFRGKADRIDERALMIDGKASAVRELVRLGERIIVYTGAGRDMWERIGLDAIGLGFPGVAAAEAAFALLAGAPPAGLAACDLWYVPGKGAVRRRYYTPTVTGGYNKEGDAQLAVLGSRIDGRLDDDVPPIAKAHATAAAAVAALQAWEVAVLARGGRMTAIEIDKDATRREDTLLSAFLEQRYRDDTQTAAWHMRAAGEIVEAIAEAGLAGLVPDVSATPGAPASDAEIAAYQALVPEPLPAPLVEVWREVGGAGFTIGGKVARFLSPRELVAERTALRDRLRAWAGANLKGRARDTLVGELDTLDVIATVGDEPAIVFDTRQRRNDKRCFCSPGSDWWEKALGWQIATDLNVLLKRHLERELGDVYRLKLGQRASDAARRVRLAKADKTWEAIVDGAELVTRTLTASSPGKPSVKRLASAAAAAKAFDAAVAAARKKGFR